jgi:hypothetical protein
MLQSISCSIDGIFAKTLQAGKPRSSCESLNRYRHHRMNFPNSIARYVLATVALIFRSAADPVRVFQEFATLDLLSNGREQSVNDMLNQLIAWGGALKTLRQPKD